jgi:hypothetical protein
MAIIRRRNYKIAISPRYQMNIIDANCQIISLIPLFFAKSAILALILHIRILYLTLNSPLL